MTDHKSKLLDPDQRKLFLVEEQLKKIQIWI